MNEEKKVVLEVRNLHKKFSGDAGFFSSRGKYVYAVNNLSFSLYKGETYGLVGESGCGKTTTARLLIKMYSCDEGKVYFFDGKDRKDIFALSKKELKSLGVNDSTEHIDFMIGTDDLEVIGVNSAGKAVQIFKNGEWII